MSFQDILNQPLPSQMGDDYVMEASTPIKIKSDVNELNKKYRSSIKNIKNKIKLIKASMNDDKFNIALNTINECRKIVISDRKDITDRIKSLESSGLDKNTIKKITAAVAAGTAITIGANAVTISNYNKTSKKHDKLCDAAGKARDAQNAARDKLDDAKVNLKNAERHEWRISFTENNIKDYDKWLKQGNLSSSQIMAYTQKQTELNRELKELKQKKMPTVNDAKKELAKAEKELAEAEKEYKRRNDITRSHVDINIDSWDKAMKTALATAPVGGAALLAGGITYPVIKSFTLIKNNYEKYYDGVQKTLDKLEDRCEKQSQNIKECLLDFVILSQDMEILLESTEEIDYIDGE